MFLWGIWTVQRRRCPPAGHAICVARCVASQWRWWGRQMGQLIALCACICGIHIWYVTVWAVCISYLKKKKAVRADTSPHACPVTHGPLLQKTVPQWRGNCQFVQLTRWTPSACKLESLSLGSIFWMRILRWWNSAFVWVLYVHSVLFHLLPRWKLQADFLPWPCIANWSWTLHYTMCGIVLKQFETHKH